MKSQWIAHKDVRIFLIDVSGFGLDHEGMRDEMDAVVKKLTEQPEMSVLALADLRGTTLSSEVTDLLRARASKIRPHFRKTALVANLSGFRRVILDTLGRFIGHIPKRFEDPEQAKDWLASNSSRPES